MPAIAWWPGVIRPGSVSMTPLSTLDVFPTFLSLGRLDPLPPAGGRADGDGKVGSGAALLPLDGVDMSRFFLSSGAEQGPSETNASNRGFFWYYADQLAAAR